MKDRLLPFRFPFRVDYVRPRARKARPAYFCENALASIPETSEADAVAQAFLIRERDSAGGWRTATEVLSHGDELWWPLQHPEREVSSDAFIDAMSTGATSAFSILNCGVPLPGERHAGEELRKLDGRRIEEDTRDYVELQIRRALSELRAFRGRLYVSGEEPVYICPVSPDGTPTCVKVAKPPGRMSPLGPKAALRGMRPSEYENLAAKGLVFDPTELELAKAAVAAPPSDTTVLMMIEPRAHRPIATDMLKLQIKAALKRVAEAVPRNGIEMFDDSTSRAAVQALRRAVSTESADRHSALALESFMLACERVSMDSHSPVRPAYQKAREAVEDIKANHRRRRMPSPFESAPDSLEDALRALSASNGDSSPNRR